MEEFYKKGKGNAGLDGVQFQISLLTVFLLNALRRLKGWRISTENEIAGKFDDVVLELWDGSAVLLQAKHKVNKKVNRDQLLSDNSKNADFSLPKYFLSYQEIKSKFNVKSVIICTNADVEEQKIKDILTTHSASFDCILHHEGEDCPFFTFNEHVLSDLRTGSEVYYDRNLKGTGMAKGVITDENVKDFLEKLQFFCNYPSGLDLNNIIDRILSRTTDSLWKGTSSTEIYKKVEDWFKHRRGEYLNETRAIAMFCEIKSDKYCKFLQDYQVLFLRNTLNFSEDKRVFHLSSDASACLVQVLKVYYALQDKKTLYADFEDGLQEHIIEAFSLQHYAFLVMICVKTVNQNRLSDIADKLNETLNKSKYKKVVLVGRKQFVQQLGAGHDVLAINSSVTFDEFTPETRKRLVKAKSINFQGEDISFEELLGTTTTEDFVRIVNSETLEVLVRGEKMKVGAKPLGLDEDTVRYYIERAIERETSEVDDLMTSYKKKKQVVTEENIFDVPEKVMLISDCAGMGKSTILAKLAVDMKEKNRYAWIIRVELNNYTRILRDSLRKRKRTIGITELLNSNAATKLNSQLEQIVFAMHKKVVLMLDGFDEISPDYTEIILNLLRECREANNFAKVIVTTRPHMNAELEETLQVKPFVLRPFTKDDQASFLTSFWTHNLHINEDCKEKCKKYSAVLINKVSSWINQENSFTAIPLQVRMIAEIFEENRGNESTEWEGCKEFLEGNGCEPGLPERMNVTELYDMFIEKKLEIYIDKVNPCGTAMGNSFDTLFDVYFVNHQGLALEIILGSSDELDPRNAELFSRYRYDSTMETAMLKIGIIQKLNGNTTFVHRTFAEYFVAKSILDVSDLQNQSFSEDVDFQKFFIDELLCNPEFAVIRAFLESVLEDLVEGLPSDIFQNYQNLEKCNPSSWKYRSKLIHLLCGEGCIAILRLILKCIRFEVRRDTVEVYITELDTGGESNTLNYLKRLVDRGGINIKAENGDTPLHLAAQRGSRELVGFLVEQGANINIRNNNNVTSLYPAAKSGRLSIVEFLVESGVEDVESKDVKGNTALQLAAQEGHLDVVRFLVQRGADVDSRNDEGFTVLHGAATEGHLEVIQLLVASGADVNVVNNYGSNALHSSACNGHLDCVVYLVGCGTDVNARVINGSTPIFSAVYGGFLDCVRFIQSAGGDVHVREHEGMSLLHMAALKGYTDVFQFLLECGVNFNGKDHKGFTALHGAASKGYLPMAGYLLDRGMQVDIENNCKSTPLHLAALNGQTDMVRLLVERGANVEAKNKHGFNVLYKDNTDTHRWILEHKTDEIHTEQGSTPLCLAVGHGRLDVVRYLTEREVNVSDGAKMLNLAIQLGHLHVVKYLVEKGVDASFQDDKGFSALHLAAGNGHMDLVKYLVEVCDIRARCNKGDTPMHLAAESGHTDIVKAFQELGCGVDEKDNNGFAVLHVAAQNGQLRTVKYLVERGADVNVRSSFGNTPLHLAALKNHWEVIEVLVAHGADVNVTCNRGFTAMHAAAAAGHLDAVGTLVRCGADTNIESENGNIPLHMAVQYGHMNIVEVLANHGVDVNVKRGFIPVHCAAGKGYLAVLKVLHAAGADLLARNDKGCIALHFAASNGHLDVVQFLVESGVDVNTCDGDGFTALHIAAQMNHLQVVRFLLEKGAPINFINYRGNTCLHTAASSGSVEVVEFLVKHGVDVNVRDKHGMTALLYSSQNGHLDTVKCLVGCGVDINEGDEGGWRPLHIATQRGHFDIVQFLVDHGVDLNARTSDGFLALHSAARMGRLSFVEYFLNCGSEINARSEQGITALHLAAAEGHLDVVKLLVETGADVTIKDNDGKTVLDEAVKKDYPDVVDFLKEQGLLMEGVTEFSQA